MLHFSILKGIILPTSGGVGESDEQAIAERIDNNKIDLLSLAQLRRQCQRLRKEGSDKFKFKTKFKFQHESS